MSSQVSALDIELVSSLDELNKLEWKIANSKANKAICLDLDSIHKSGLSRSYYPSYDFINCVEDVRNKVEELRNHHKEFIPIVAVISVPEAKMPEESVELDSLGETEQESCIVNATVTLGSVGIVLELNYNPDLSAERFLEQKLGNLVGRFSNPSLGLASSNVGIAGNSAENDLSIYVDPPYSLDDDQLDHLKERWNMLDNNYRKDD